MNENKFSFFIGGKWRARKKAVGAAWHGYLHWPLHLTPALENKEKCTVVN